MSTGDRVWRQLDVAADEAGQYMKRLQAIHPDGGLFVRRDDGSLLTKVPPNADADACLEQLGAGAHRVVIFYEEDRPLVGTAPTN
jgi:hypothetical protein